MIKILPTSGNLAGTLFTNIDTNFIELCSALLKLANPLLELKGYADNASEPASPATNDCYLVLANGTVWELTVEKNQIITWSGTAWVVEPYKITQLNAALQALYFECENMNLSPVYGMTATNAQEAIEQLAAAVFGANPEGSGSGSGGLGV